jgi:hypothetical protein
MDHVLSVRRRIAAVALTLAALFALPAPTLAQALRNGPLPAPLPLFPPDNWWNVDISAAPVDPNSANFINFIGATVELHPDFGGDSLDDPPPAIYGMPYISVSATQPLLPVTWMTPWNESDDGFPGRPIGYPIPEEAKTQAKWIEGGHPGNVAPDPGGDRHMLIVDRDNRILYELYRAFWNPIDSRWEADSGAIYSLDSNHRRPEGWTSADAAGLAILPGLLRYDEVFSPNPNDPIRHAFRFTVFPTNGYAYPASHDASTSSHANALPMGARLRLKASKDISGYAPEIRKIFQAMKTYGLILADNGSDMYIQGTYDTRWDNGELNPAFDDLKASDFEVIQLGWRPSTTTPPGPQDFYTLAPCRLLDTRQPYGATGGPALAPAVPRVIVATGRCGVPANARALALNVTVFNPPGGGNVRLFPGDRDSTGTSTLNFSTGITRANNAIVPLAASGSGALAVQSSTAGVHVVLDVMGYFL